MPLLCSVQSWYKIPCQGASLLILVRQEKSSSCQGGQLLKAGVFMPLRQQLELAVQPQNHITWLFSSGKGLMFYLFSSVLLHFIPKWNHCPLDQDAFSITSPFPSLFFSLCMLQKSSSCPHEERWTPHFASNHPEYSFLNFISLLLHVPPQLPREAVRKEMFFSLQKAVQINIFLCPKFRSNSQPV